MIKLYALVQVTNVAKAIEKFTNFEIHNLWLGTERVNVFRLSCCNLCFLFEFGNSITKFSNIGHID